jgi:hypothetical protein
MTRAGTVPELGINSALCHCGRMSRLVASARHLSWPVAWIDCAVRATASGGVAHRSDDREPPVDDHARREFADRRARLGCGLVVAPFAAPMSYGGLKQVAHLYSEACAKHRRTPGRMMCSYFIHFYGTKGEGDAARARRTRYYKECVIPALPGDPRHAQSSTGISSI